MSDESQTASVGKQIVFSRTREMRPDEGAMSKHRVLHARSNVQMRDAYRMLRAQVLARMTQENWHSLAIVSCARGDGRTTTAVNLAISVAGDPEHSALLVDLDLRTAGVAATFGLKPTPDLVDYLFGEVALADVLVHPCIDRLTLLSARPLLSAAEVLSSRHAQSLLEELRGRYRDRIVIYDLPPLLACAEGLAVLPAVDAVVVVVRDGVTRRDELLRLFDLLGDKPILGTVMNAARDMTVYEQGAEKRGQASRNGH